MPRISGFLVHLQSIRAPLRATFPRVILTSSLTPLPFNSLRIHGGRLSSAWLTRPITSGDTDDSIVQQDVQVSMKPRGSEVSPRHLFILYSASPGERLQASGTQPSTAPQPTRQSLARSDPPRQHLHSLPQSASGEGDLESVGTGERRLTSTGITEHRRGNQLDKL